MRRVAHPRPVHSPYAVTQLGFLFCALGEPVLAARLQPQERAGRINFRIDRVCGMESHFVRGRAKKSLRCGLVVAVMMVTALGHVRTGRPEMMRSLVRGPDLKAA